MRMLERRAGRRAVVLEDQDVAEPPILLQVGHPLAVRPEHLLDLRLAHRRQRLVVIRRLDDHFVRADAVHPIEQPLAFAIEIALHLQRRKPVRHDAEVPARRVRRAAVLPERPDLGRRHVLVAGTERAVLAGDDAGALEMKIGRPLLAIGGNDHPAAGDGILAELRQWGNHREIYNGEFTMNNVGTQRAGRVEGIRNHFNLRLAGAELDRDDVEAAGALAQPVAHQVVHRGHHNPPTLGHRDRLCSIAELPAFARLDFDEHQRRAVARDDVYFGTAVPVAPGKNFIPSPRQLRAREILADLTETLPRLRHRP